MNDGILQPRASEPPPKRRVAWVLEDSPQQAHVIHDALAPLADVRLFQDGLGLLEALSDQPPDVLVLDWHVPHLSGFELLKLVRETHDEVTLPILMLTAYASDGKDMLAALEAGANDYTTKPFLPAELRARVATLLRVRSLHARARCAEAELARALKQAATGEERLRRVLEASGAGLWDLDVVRGEVRADARLIELMGLPDGSRLTLESGLRVVHPDDVPLIRAAVEGALRGDHGGVCATEFRIGGRDGVPLRWLEGRARATFDAHGVGIALAGAMIDATARKLAEREREALRASAHAEAQREREKLYRLFVHAPVAMAVLEGPRHVFTFANAAYRALVDGRDVVGKPLAEALPDVTGMGFDKMLDDVMATGEALVVEELAVRLQHHRGDEALIVNFTYTALTNELGERNGVVVFGWDVTELVRSRQRADRLAAEVRANETRLRTVTNAIPLLVSFVTADETYGYANKAYEEWFGIPADKLLGRKVRDVIGEAAYGVLGAYVKRGLAGERFSFEQYGVPYRLGGTRDVRVSFVPLVLEQGERGGYVALLQDITEQRALEAEREALERERSAQYERQSQFEQQLIGIVSHDLRTPLNVIVLSSARLARDEGLSAGAHKSVARLQNAAERATRMIADLLDFTQARLGGGLRIERRSCDVPALFEGLLAELETTFPEREIQYTHEGSLDGYWDPERVSQLAQNLITNALKYSPAGTSVRVATAVTAQGLALSVHNEGGAIPADKLPFLFEPLQRGVSEIDRVTRSVGLGLYIVQKIVDAHGGSVQVESTNETGTTFTVLLPSVPQLPAGRQ